jgi:hypothetical protein
MKRSITFALIVVAILFSGCEQEDLTVKPYPKNLGKFNKVLYDNKQFWNIDLKDDMDDFNEHTRRTFEDIEAQKERYRKRYNKKPSKSNEANVERNSYEAYRDLEDYSGILDEQYN